MMKRSTRRHGRYPTCYTDTQKSHFSAITSPRPQRLVYIYRLNACPLGASSRPRTCEARSPLYSVTPKVPQTHSSPSPARHAPSMITLQSLQTLSNPGQSVHCHWYGSRSSTARSRHLGPMHSARHVPSTSSARSQSWRGISALWNLRRRPRMRFTRFRKVEDVGVGSGS